MDGYSRKLFALGLLGVAAALVWISLFEVGVEAALDSQECSLHDDPVEGAPVIECLQRCSNINDDCEQFFVGKPWPPSSYGDSSASCRICQTQGGKDGVFFATLYSPKYRIPEYTSAAITRDPAKKQHKRVNDASLWKRVRIGLCSSTYQNELLKSNKKSGVIKVPKRDSSDEKLMDECGDCQAFYEDLEGCKNIVDRGHLNPNHINDKDKAAQDATFSMINMAPQAPKFNTGIWKSLENQIMKKAEKIFKNKNNKILYVITGTKIGNKDKWVKGRVLFPRFFWKAVCYTGDEGVDPFGVGVYGRNNDTTKKEDMAMLRLFEFNEWLYGKNTGKHIFQGSVCEDKDSDKIEMWDPQATPNPKPKKTERGGL